ncbi:outer membrane protein assembly factor BamD, BamD/ComL family [Terrimicrobium sacchariphilum]|uniref:Outer membrane protein assembly factor BamD, BamD/ComL family n=1 Tax=Terrimicrobium sacchariphilum TaxID=690879 RepID=A0A146G610_TERSA|nr:tetratricopeptide repeat protein [Terrimicrobium sacchariphilum]GAT33020.1 outer membrane protein assembly factor BamD, BamD/ComL family [Terrimicrobium sacchariphilum]
MSFACPSSRRTTLATSVVLASLVVGIACSGVRAVGAAPAAPDALATTEKVMKAHGDGMSAFSANDFAGAITNLNQFFSLLPASAPPEWQSAIEAAYLTLAAANFNTANYSAAISSWEKFLSKFPASPKVNEARMNLAIAALKSGVPSKAKAQFALLQQLPAYRNQILLYQASLSMQEKKPAEAIPLLEALTGKPPLPDSRQKAAASQMLAEALLSTERWDEASRVIRVLQDHPARIDNPLQLNILTLSLGDHYSDKGELADALAYYAMARLQADLIALQEKKIAELKQAIENEKKKPATQDAAGTARLADLENAVAAAEEALGGFRQLSGFDESVWFRIARAYSTAGRPWESYLVLRHMLEEFPKSPLRESMMSLWIYSMADIVPYKETQAACAQYLKEFPKGERAEEISYLNGALALQHQDLASAATFFGVALKDQPKNPRRGEMVYLLGNVNFMQGRLPEARKQYEGYLREFPSGEYAEEIICRLGLSYFFEGDLNRAVQGFNQYLEKYPKGNFRAEAKYRLEVADYAAKDYDKVIASCQSWAKEFPEDPLQAENAALLGDTYAALERFPEAAAAYASAVRLARTDEVLQYALQEAQKSYQKTGDWESIGKLFQEFVDTHPDSPLNVMAIYWVGRARERLGQPTEARRITAENVKRYIADRRRDGVEQLLLLYAQLASRKRADNLTADHKAGTTQGIDEEIASSLADPETELPLVKARILYAQAEAARLKRNPERANALLDQIARDFKPEDLSAPLLAMAGDRLLTAGDTERAKSFYEVLKSDFPKSANIDAAEVGLGRLALLGGDTDGAQKHFQAAIARPGSWMPQALVGLGRTQMAMSQYREATKTFQQVASTRQWRGEPTAESLYWLGEIERKQQKYAEANAYFQRVYVSWLKFPHWVARSYLASADCFLRMNKPQEAIRTWQEMLRQDALSKLPEFATARKELATHQSAQ